MISRAAAGGGLDRLGAELAGDEAVALVEVVHREVDTLELAARNGQIAWDPRACGQHDRVVGLGQLLGADVRADVHTAAQLDALGHQLLHATLDDGLFDLEVRHAEAHQAAGRLVALEQRHPVP